MRAILEIIAELNLQDGWLCAGSIRNFIWNKRSQLPAFDQKTDVDVIFFDPQISCEETCQLEENLKKTHPQYRWELKNQVYMHNHNPQTLTYLSARDVMFKYPETCTAIGVRLTSIGQVEVYCPYGLEAICEFIVRPTPYFLDNAERMSLYDKRIAKKNWGQKWPQLQFRLD
ncbi:nucleotidyltransferase family protein [Streptococcus sp. X16XC17]|uniref:nucleotidyltransferase family protein n=1 Tax=unclassified Streptococcus TaxID=2608887 RepID=UPI00066FDB72|nr:MULTISPECIES: nucleotidyltransferase family protein [unclassified Streptococcus]TCD45914.1 nucleotidyltransferase family protein [Streptococcus sp. X16XC17]